MTIVEITEPGQFADDWKVLRELRTSLTQTEFVERLPRLRLAGFRLFALLDDAVVQGLAGVVVRENFFDGRFLWVEDLVVTSESRSKGCGKQLMDFIEEFARRHRCERIALASGLHRTDAHRFYLEKCGMEATSYVFRKFL